MKKSKIVNCDGSELEVYFPTNKDWVSMTGGTPDQLASYHEDELEEQAQVPWGDYEGADFYQKKAKSQTEVFEEVVKGYEEEGEGKVYAALTKSFLNKIKLQESESQIKIDDTIPSDFLDTFDLHLGSIYVVAGLGLTAKFVGRFATTVPDGNKILLQMKRHDTVFYVEEGQLMKATSTQVDNYLNEPF